MSRDQCLLRYGRCSFDLYSRCPMWFPYMSTQLSALRRTEVRTLLKIPGYTRISWQAFSTRCWSALNTPKSSGVFTAKNPEDWGQGIVQASWLGPRVLSTIHRRSGSGAAWQCGENEAVPHHAWTTYVVDEEAHVPRVLVNHSPKGDGTLHLLVC
jgi:hypothetical protein